MGLWCAWPQASVGVATFATFLISAILHELLFSVAFKTFKAWFFLGMLMQIPLIFISRFFKGKRRGNFLVWLSLFASQPLLEVCSNLNHGAWRWWVRLVEAADVMTDGCRYCTSELGTKPMTTSSVCPRKKACSTTTLTALAQPVLVRDALRYQAYMTLLQRPWQQQVCVQLEVVFRPVLLLLVVQNIKAAFFKQPSHVLVVSGDNSMS